MIKDDQFIKIYEITNKAVKKYQDRVQPVYLSLSSFILLLIGIFTFIHLDIHAAVDAGRRTQELAAWANVFYGILLFTLIGSLGFVSYAFFVPESNLFQPIVKDYEKQNLLIETQNFTIIDYDTLFFYMESKVDSLSSDEYMKRYLILKVALEDKLLHLFETETLEQKNLKSRYLNLFFE